MSDKATAVSRVERISLSAISDERTLIVVLFLGLVAGLALVLVVMGQAAQTHFALASATLIMGTLAILLASFRILQKTHESRLHKILTAMTAAEQARAQAEAAAREKTRLLATMSHEIRTPLNGVIGMIGLLLETELSAEQQNYAVTANSSSRILLSIIDEILDTAKAQSVTAQKDVEIASLVETVTELLAPRAHAKGIEVSGHVAVDVPQHILGDDLRLRQILFNLAGNAIKFTERGGVSIDVSLNDQNQLLIAISDTGIGMTAEETERVFEEFVQANDSTQRRYGGTGLGLAISRKLVGAMDGKLALTSALGQGTTFTITLPGPYVRQISETALPLINQRFVLAMKPGLSVNHLTKSLRDFGAAVTHIATSKELQKLLIHAAPETQVISDVSHASVLMKWAMRNVDKSVPHAKIWVMMKAEERREFRSLLNKPFAGYLLNPLRRSTLLAQLKAPENDSLAQASTMLRKMVAGAKPQSQVASGFTVLLAEDNPVNALLARTMLERCGHKVLHVSNGLAALETLAQGTMIDVALLDLEMPKMDGYETARAIRQREFERGISASAALPLLALTANARSEDIVACLAAGMNDHLAKPFDQLDLEEKVKRLIGRRLAA